MALIIALLGLAATPALASAHSLVRPAEGVISYLSEDATSLNTLTVAPAGSMIDFRDPTVDGGIDPGSCDPGDVAGSFIVQVLCPSAGVTRLRIDLGEREDTATISVPIAATLLGGAGADQLTGGPAADELVGDSGDDALAAGDGDDALDGGLGSDHLDGASGNDRLISRDGIADVITCGDGADEVDADTVDEISGDCESVTKTPTPPPSGYVLDKPGPPAVAVGAETVQKLKRSGRVRVYATSSEVGTVSASGFLEIAGLSLPLITESRPIAVGGAGAAITYKLSRERLRRAGKALAAGRKVRVVLSVVGTDLAGNSNKKSAPRIRLAAGRPAAKAGTSSFGHARSLRHPEPGDVDGDEILDGADNCPFAKNGSQINTDAGFASDPGPPPMPAGDAAGDACDGDDDADGVADVDGSGAKLDNCRIDRNPLQEDDDGDGNGDACPPVDSDLDEVIDDDDNCDFVANPNQQDLDGDDKGDACDGDDDGDRFDDEFDNCPSVYNIEPTDVDGDGLINDQLDGDGDGIGTACDPDESAILPPGDGGPDNVAPRAEVRAQKRQSLGQLDAGMIVRLRCSEACTATAEIVVDRVDARRLDVGRDRVVAAGSAQLDASGSTYAFVRLDRRVRRALSRVRTTDARLLTGVVDGSGNVRRLSRPVSLGR